MTKLELMKIELEEKKNLLKEDHYKDINDPMNIELAKRVTWLEYEIEAEEQREGYLERRKEELENLENIDATKVFLLSKEEKDGLPIRIEYLKKEIEKI